nr:hypothetical protein [uncultured Dyadobacter sp.]
MGGPDKTLCILDTLALIWQTHRRIRILLSTAMRKDGCTCLRSILAKAHISSVIFERDIEGLYDSLKDCLADSQLDHAGFNPGRIRQHGLTRAILVDTIINQWDELRELYCKLLDQTGEEGIIFDRCGVHIAAIHQISASAKSRISELFQIQDPARSFGSDRTRPALPDIQGDAMAVVGPGLNRQINTGTNKLQMK